MSLNCYSTQVCAWVCAGLFLHLCVCLLAQALDNCPHEQPLQLSDNIWIPRGLILCLWVCRGEGSQATRPPNRKSRGHPDILTSPAHLHELPGPLSPLPLFSDNFPRRGQTSGRSSGMDVRFFPMLPHRRVFVSIRALGVHTAGPCPAPLTPQWGFMPPRSPSPT